MTTGRQGIVVGVLVVGSVVGCSTHAEKADRADDGNVIVSIHEDDFEMAQPGEYTSATADPRKPGLVVAHAGRATAFRAHQSGTGTAVQVVADGTTAEAPALDVRSAGEGAAARFAGGRVVVGEGGTLALESIVHVRAADAITVEAPASVVVVDRSEGVQANNLRLVPPTEGQLLWIVNDDDDVASLGPQAIPAGELRQFLYVAGAFRPVN